MLITDLEYYKKSKNYQNNICGIDEPYGRETTYKRWHAYPIQNFTYNYNDWGFRANFSYDKYVGKPVNLCLGDSFTANVGGPIEYSWASQLAKKFDIPTLNFGMDGAGNDAIKLVYERVCKVFDVQTTFVMYSFVHRRLIDNKFSYQVNEDKDNYTYFAKQRIANAIECALPSWVWAYGTELEHIRSTGLFLLDIQESQLFSDDVNINRACVVEKSYNNLRGPDWPTYKNFVTGAEIHPDMLTEKFGNFIKPSLQYKNRDGYHLSHLGHQIYANYLYQQWSQHES